MSSSVCHFSVCYAVPCRSVYAVQFFCVIALRLHWCVAFGEHCDRATFVLLSQCA